MTNIAVNRILAVFALGTAACAAPNDALEDVDQARNAIAHPTPSDLVVVGQAGPTSVTNLARSNGNGTFTATLPNTGSFQAVTAAAGASTLNADFNNDGLTDLCVTGSASATAIVCAIANGNGQFAITSQAIGAYASWANQSPVRLAHDYNADGRADIALLGGSGFGSIPIAFSTGSGTFNVTNVDVALFAGWANNAAASKLAGDFDGDGDADIALVGGGLGSLPVAFSNRNGGFTVTNQPAGNFPSWASMSGAVHLVGDFNADGRSDIAVTGVSGFNSVPVAFSNGNGSFNVANVSIGNFATWAAQPNSSKVVGDFNFDGRADIVILGGGFTSIPVALSQGTGAFTVVNQSAGNFPSWASMAGVSRLLGDFNFDGRTDIALTGVSGWTTIPVAFSNGSGAFSVTNHTVQFFPAAAAGAGTRELAGNFQF